MVERQELYCHDCGKYVQFDVELELDGNHIFECPNCGHEHCRVVAGGKITGIRWAQRNGPTIPVYTNTITTTNTSTYDTYTQGSTQTSTASTAAGGTYCYGSWMNTTGANN